MSTCTTDSEYKCLTNFLWVDADCKELDDQKKTSQSEFKELPLIVKWRSIPPPPDDGQNTVVSLQLPVSHQKARASLYIACQGGR